VTVSPVVWIPALFAVALGLVLWGGMSWAFDRGYAASERDEEDARERRRELARRQRRAPRTELVGDPAVMMAHQRALEARRHPVYLAADRAWEMHQQRQLAAAAAQRDPHPSGPMPAYRHQPQPELTDSAFTRQMAAEVDRGMAEVERILRGEEP
jgi:hypothetical protein